LSSSSDAPIALEDMRPSPDVKGDGSNRVHHEHTAEAIGGFRLATIFFCLSILLLLSLMDETVVATALIVISTCHHSSIPGSSLHILTEASFCSGVEFKDFQVSL
jgi:hypothetical protein